MNTNDAYAAVQEALAAGRAWGEQEVELWSDQHEGSFADAPAWTRGTYCGHLPRGSRRPLIEAIIDIEAERVWNEARETIAIGDRVWAGAGDDYDEGKVEQLDCATAYVAWDSGVKGEAEVDDLRKVTR